MNPNETHFLRAWIPKTSDGKSLMFYQDDQYIASFIRRVCAFASGMTHESYAVGKYILMLSTGRVDSNKRIIFDGDIVEDGVGYIYLVEVRDNGIYQKCVHIGEEDGEDESCYISSEDYLSGSTILGNRFENPEFFKNFNNYE